MRYINFKDSSCYSIDTPFYLINVESGKYWADGVVYIQYNTNISGQDVGIPIYFEKVLTNGVWDETTVIIRNYNVNGVWDKPKIHGSDTTALNSDDKNRTNPTFKIVDNGDDTFKIKINARTDYVGFQTSGGNIVNPVRINRTNNGSNFINWAIVRADSDYTIGRTYSDDFIEFTDDRCFSQSNPVYLCNVDARKWWADGVSYNSSNSSISAQSTGIPIYLEKVLSEGTWDGSTVKLHMYNNSNTWDEVYYDSSNNTLLSNNQNQQSNTFSLTANEDGSFKMKLNSLSTLVGFREYISNYEGVYRYLVQPISTDISSSEAAAHTNWAISTTQNPTLHRYIANDTSNPQLIAIAQSQGWIESGVTDLFSDDVILPASDANSTSIFSTLTSFAELAYCEEITQIPDYCFYNCTSLSGLTFHNGITSIGESAFMGCTSLTRFYAGDPINIGANAFKNSGISQFALGPSISTIGSDAFVGLTLGWVRFYDLTSMFSVTYSNANSNPISRTLKTGNLGRVVIGDGSDVVVESITVPSTITEIKPYALYYGQAFTTITLHNNVTSIGAYAFYNCRALTTFDTKNVQTIGTDAFRGCVAMTTITVGAACTTINGATFHGCTNLTRVNCASISSWLNITFASIHSTPLTNGAHLYVGNTEQTSITIPNDITTIKRFAFYNAIYVKKIIIPETVTTVQTYAFQNCNLLKSAGPIGSGCNIEFGWTTRMPSYAFHSANYLETVIIPSTLTTIRDRSFAYCSSLKYIDLPESCVTIEVEGLRGCTSLECIAIRAGNINIQAEALTGDTNLRRVYFSNSTPPKSTSTFVNITSGEAFVWVPEGSKSAYETFFSGKGYTVKEGEDFSLPLEYLDNSALLSIAQTEHWIPTGESSLTTLDVAQVTTFENIDFSNITALGELPYFKALTSIPDDCFYGSTLAGDITIPSNITSIGDSAFKGTAITNINIPNATLTEDSFANCLYLKRVDLGEDVNWATGENPFTGLGRNTKFYVNEDNENIKNSNYNDSILSANGTVFRTGSAACGIPKEVTTIESKAFKNSQKTQIVISDNITTIGADAFSGCNFNKVFCRKLTPPNFTISGTTLYVENSCIPAYQTAWPNFTYYKAYKTIEMPSYRRYHIEDIYEWTVDYKRLSWIATYNNERPISTGVSIKDVGGIELEGALSSNSGYSLSNTSNYFLCARANSKNFGFWHPAHGTGNWTRYALWNGVSSGSKNVGNQMSIYSMNITGQNSVRWQFGSLNGTMTVTNVSQLTPDADIKLMCNRYAGCSPYNTSMKIYAVKLYGRKSDGTKADELVANMIPAKRLSDSKVGLYDTVRNSFHYSENGGLHTRPALYVGDTFTPNTSTWLDGTYTNQGTYWDFHHISANCYHNNSSDWGKSTNFYRLAEPGTIVFTNPTEYYNLRFMLLNEQGMRLSSKDAVYGASITWEITKNMIEATPYLGLLWWRSEDFPSIPALNEATLKTIDWSFTYE